MLSVYDLESATLRDIASQDVGFGVTWLSEDVVVQGPANRNLLLLRQDSGDRQVAVADSAGWNFTPKATRDGRRLAYFKNRGEDSGVWIKDQVPAGPERRLMNERARPLRFDSTGELVYVAEAIIGVERTQRIWELAVTTGERRVLATLPMGFAAEDITEDGQIVLASQVEWRGDAWRLTPAF